MVGLAVAFPQGVASLLRSLRTVAMFVLHWLRFRRIYNFCLVSDYFGYRKSLNYPVIA